MAKNISYDAVLTKNLSLPKLKVEQIEVVLDISGADPDPLTLPADPAIASRACATASWRGAKTSTT